MLLPDSRCGSGFPGSLVSPVFARLPRVLAGFTTSALGDAKAPHGGDAVARALGPDDSAWTRDAVRQVHGSRVVEAGDDTASDEPPEADGLWTSRRGRLLVVRSADCLPVLFAALGSGGVSAVAAAHAGWRGLAAGVLPATVRALEAAAPASRILAMLGPCIGACCFEIGPEVAAALVAASDDRFVRPGSGDRSFADLAGIARFQLAAAGAAAPDRDAPPCTRCHGDLFPSHRRDGARAGRMAAIIGLRPA